MSEQVVDLRSTWAILRRRGRTLALAVALGAVVAGGLAYLRPPLYASTSIVLLPPLPKDTGGDATTHEIDTQVQIARSSSVLGRAAKAMKPPMSIGEVEQHVQVAAPTTDVLRITATGTSAKQAQTLSEAVARSHVSYLEEAANALSEDQRSALSARRSTLKKNLSAVNDEINKTSARLEKEDKISSEGRADAAALAELTAQQAQLALQLDEIKKQVDAGLEPRNGEVGGGASVIQNASPAERPGLIQHIAILAGLGAAVFLLLAAVYVVLTGRKDRTLRSRDQIADAIGVPVVASLESRAVRSATGWSELLQGYSPHNVDRWALRQLLRLVTPGTPGSLIRNPDPEAESQPVVILTVSNDHAALSAGPQFASFVASTGVSTELVAAQSHETANALWAACSRLPGQAEIRSGLAVTVRQDVRHHGDLVVLLAVLDRRNPELYLYRADNAVTLLAVTAGSVTAEDLANVAVASDNARHPLDGIVVIDPDPLDRTSGRLLPADRVQHIPLPTLMTGSKPSGTVSSTTRQGQR